MKLHRGNQAALTEEDLRRRNALAKMLLVLILLFLIILFGSIAWFSMNTGVSTDGLGVTAGARGFELRVSTENEETAGEKIGFHNLYGSGFLDYVHSLLGITTGGSNGQTICWRMADGDKKLMPGSEGSLEFQVVPSGTLRYSIDYTAYTADTEEARDEQDNVILDEDGLPVENVLALHEITESSEQDEQAGVAYLKSHILFFTGRETVTTKVAGKTFYRYHGWIEDPSDFTMTPDANGNVTIYWIWPNTFGQLALYDRTDAENFPYLRETVSVLDDTGEGTPGDADSDRAKLTAYLQDADNSVFAGSPGENTTFAAQLSALYSNRTTGTAYEKLSEGYNSADQIIGKNLDFVMLKLTADAQ